MDASLIDSFLQILIEWGYVGLFISALLAGSVIPFSSELVLVGVVQLGLSPMGCVLAATAGNVAGGMTCYYMGHLGRVDWIEKYFHVKHEKILKMQHTLQGPGALMAFFAFLPIIGSVISITLGYMRANLPLTITAMSVGKFLRYMAMIWAMEGVATLF